VARGRFGECRRIGGSVSRAAACAIGVGVAVPVIVLGAVAASVLTVAVGLFRAVLPSATAAPVQAGIITPRSRTTALQRAAADEAAS
jgi:hypothetical protein